MDTILTKGRSQMRLVQKLYIEFDNKKSSLFSKDVEVWMYNKDFRCKIRNAGGKYKVKREDGKIKEIDSLDNLFNFLVEHKLKFKKEVYLWLN